MRKTLLLAGLCAAALVAQPALAQAPDMSLTRLDCDWDVLTSAAPPQGANPAPFAAAAT
jgi:hypothetical protein